MNATEFLSQASEQPGYPLANVCFTLLMALLGLGVTYVSTRVSAWVLRSGYRLTRAAGGALWAWWRPAPCPVASELLTILASDQAIVVKGDLLIGDLTFTRAVTDLSAVMDEKTDLLPLLPSIDKDRVTGAARVRYAVVAEEERQRKQESVAEDLRKARQREGVRCSPESTCRSSATKRA